MHDDLFVIVQELVTSVPQAIGFAALLVLLSIVLTWVKWNADKRFEEDREKEECPELPVLCAFPLCGKPLSEIAKEEWEKSKSCDVLYCSVACRKRDWRENNHHSVSLLLKRRAQELAQQKEVEERSRAVGWQQQLFDLIPNPHGAYSVDIGTVFDSVSRQVEFDAAKLTARTFAAAYMKKFGLAVHVWATECFGCCGRGCVLVHLSEKAMEESSGAPVSYVQRRLLQPLRDYPLNKLLREYDPSTQIVLYILQRGVDRRQLAFPVCYSVYENKDKAGQVSKSVSDKVQGGASGLKQD